MNETVEAPFSNHNQFTPRQTTIEESLHKIRNPFEQAGTDPEGNVVGAHDVAAERYAVAVNEALGDGDDGEAWTARKIRAELLRDPKTASRFDGLAEQSTILQELDESLATQAETRQETGKVAVKSEAVLDTDFDQEIAVMDAAVEQKDEAENRVARADAAAASSAALEAPGANNNGVNNEEFARQQLLIAKLDLRSLRLSAEGAHPKSRENYADAIEAIEAEEALWTRTLKSEGSMADDAFVRERAMSLRGRAKQPAPEAAPSQPLPSENGGAEPHAESEKSPSERLSKLQEKSDREQLKIAENLERNSIYVCMFTPALEALRGLYPEDDALASRLDAFAAHVEDLDRQKRDAGEKDAELALGHAIQDTYETFLSDAERQALIRASENEKQRQERLTHQLENALPGSSLAPAPAFIFDRLCKEIR